MRVSVHFILITCPRPARLDELRREMSWEREERRVYLRYLVTVSHPQITVILHDEDDEEDAHENSEEKEATNVDYDSLLVVVHLRERSKINSQEQSEGSSLGSSLTGQESFRDRHRNRRGS